MKLKATALFLMVCFCTLTAFGQGQNYWQQQVEYEMDIVMDVDQHQFTGTQTLTYHNNSPDTLHRVFYHLYFNAFQPGSMMDVRSRTIEDPDSRVKDRIYHLTEDQVGYHHIQSLAQNGEPVDYNIQGTVMEVTLNEPVLPGEEVVFEMEFESQVPQQIRRSGWNNAEGVEYSMSQWYPKMAAYDKDGWHSDPYVGREFYGVFGTFDVKITIDADYVLGATGFLQNAEDIGYGYSEEEVQHDGSGTLTWHWQAEKVHDFAWAADPDYVHTTAQVPNGPTLHFLYQADTVAANADTYSQEQLRQNWEKLPEFTVKAFQYMSKHFGKYPYDKFTVIQGGDGGMEYPMATLITGNRSFGSLVGVTVHEFVHMWYYGVLASDETDYPWMDEGFTTYASSLIMQHLFGGNDRPHQGSYRSYFYLHEMGDFEALDTPADHFHTNRGYGVASYSTGAVFLNQLRYIVGNEAFDQGMLRYFELWKFKHPDGRDFLRVMEESSDMVLDWYYQYFIESTKTIDYGIKSVVSGDEGNTFVTLERIDLTPMPLDVMVTYSDGSQELIYIPLRIMRGEKTNNAYPDVQRTIKTDWPWVNPTYTFEIDAASSSIKKIEIDPSHRLADVGRQNNTIIIEKLSQPYTEGN